MRFAPSSTRARQLSASTTAKQVITAARHTLPEFVVCAGLFDPDSKTIELYVENYKDAK